MGLGRHFATWSTVVLAGFALTGSAAAGGSAPEIRGLHVAVDAGVGGRFGGRVDVEVTYRVVNPGPTTIHPTTRLHVGSQIGGGTTTGPTRIPTLAPGESFAVREVVTGILPLGSVNVEVTVRAGGATSTAEASAVVIPWFLVLTLLFVAAIAWAIRRRR